MAGEANPGVESPATGWAQVGGCGAWDAGNSRLSQFTVNSINYFIAEL